MKKNITQPIKILIPHVVYLKRRLILVCVIVRNLCASILRIEKAFHANLKIAQHACSEILISLRENARFAIQKKSIDGQLPHNAEIRIQNGAVKGLVKILQEDQLDEQDIYTVFQLAIEKYKSIECLPYSELMQEISAYQVRRARHKKK